MSPRSAPIRRRRRAVSVLALVAASVAFALATTACGDARRAEAAPRASFLVAAGDSTFWVDSDGDRVTLRRSPMLLAEHAGHYYELYLTDDDQSYYDAVILGQRIFRRDLNTGDSLLLLEDSTLARLAADYARGHPGESPLAPDEDVAEEPSTHATTETELLDVSGPFLTYEQHVDLDVVGERDQHVTRRGVLDVRDGHAVAVADLVGRAQASEIHRQGQRLLAMAMDSIRRANDERARRAATALTGFVFDSLSFALVEDEGAPAVAFLVPGRGPRAGGFALPLPPLRITEGPWWASIRAGLPTAPAGGATWRGAGYDVIARDDSAGESAVLVLRKGPNEWPVGRVPTPVRRVHRLDDPRVDAATIHGLRRAFDESALYSGDTRTASFPSFPRTPVIWVSHSHLDSP
ncbi:MAG: hypothetical protein IPK33_02015 [Gemmatimonadetes bacterium]|nr:hypothetical protein [Gemmatimonadota bacterium]MBK9408220.1 hypothetical protein [Gemmatimonadota bacterium]